MKIKSGLISHQIDTQYITVASGDAGEVFKGMIRSNGIVVDILKMLECETSEEKIVEQLYAQYDAPQEVIAKDVHQIIERIRKAGLLDEWGKISFGKGNTVWESCGDHVIRR